MDFAQLGNPRTTKNTNVELTRRCVYPECFPNSILRFLCPRDPLHANSKWTARIYVASMAPRTLAIQYISIMLHYTPTELTETRTLTHTHTPTPTPTHRELHRPLGNYVAEFKDDAEQQCSVYTCMLNTQQFEAHIPIELFVIRCMRVCVCMSDTDGVSMLIPYAQTTYV
jgi:hypothetical protein